MIRTSKHTTKFSNTEKKENLSILSKNIEEPQKYLSIIFGKTDINGNIKKFNTNLILVKMNYICQICLLVI